MSEIPELEPIDGRGRTYLVGTVEQPRKKQRRRVDDGDDQDMSDEEVLDLFGELCREVLPTDGSWLSAMSVLNEGKRLLEDGAGLELPASRPTGWYRNLLERTAGIELHTTDRGHMKVRRG